jgi:spore germination cell wall hydrolase CwlJ-like protein
VIIGDDHHVPACVGVAVEDHKDALSPVDNQIINTIGFLQRAAKNAAEVALSALYEFYPPGSPKMFHATSRSNKGFIKQMNSTRQFKTHKGEGKLDRIFYIR